MFYKHDSSILSNKGKKSVDVPLRKSDRKSLLKVARALFGCITTADDCNDILSAVFMEGTLTSRKILHPQLNKVVLYYRSPSNTSRTNEKNQEQSNHPLWPYTLTSQCVWMTVDAGPSQHEIHAPTVALLSVSPRFPTVVVPSNVSKYVCRGAHLMRAGISQLPAPSHITTANNIVAIQVHGNPQPFAVGYLTEGTTLQTIGPSSKGVGVELWTCYGDDFWKQQLSGSSASARTENGIMNPTGGACFDNNNYGNVGFLEGKIVRPIVAIHDEDSSADESETAVESAVNAVEEQVAALTMNDTASADTNPNDAILHQAVCEALVNIKDSELPMTSTHFYAQLVKPRCDAPLDIKKTRWKKFNTYLKNQVENDLIECKSHNTDPMGYLVGINRRHDDLDGIQKDVQEISQTKKLTVVNLFVVPHHYCKLLRFDSDVGKAANAKSEERRGTGMLTTPEVKAILDDYVRKNELLITPTKVQLDGPLTDALFKKQSNPPTTLLRKEIYKLWMNKMESAYALVEMPGSRIAKLGRGAPPQVSIEVSLRQGRKKYSTKVRGLEDYDIDPVAFTKEVTKRFACAGTVETEPEGRAALKKGCVELDFQGHLVEELRALLVGDEKLCSHGGAKDSEYALPKSAIDVTLKKNVPAKKPRK